MPELHSATKTSQQQMHESHMNAADSHLLQHFPVMSSNVTSVSIAHLCLLHHPIMPSSEHNAYLTLVATSPNYITPPCQVSTA